MSNHGEKLDQSRSFETGSELEVWLQAHHATAVELWVRVFKKHSGVPSVNWNDCVVAAIAWGWIDGQKRSLDEASYLQRLSPRRARSNWSKRNCEHAERLIAEGRMQPAGLAHVQNAKSDGRWEKAYCGSADMVLPEDFLQEVAKHPTAQANFDNLDRRSLFAIYCSLHSAKLPETRERRMAKILRRLLE